MEEFSVYSGRNKLVIYYRSDPWLRKMAHCFF